MSACTYHDDDFVFDDVIAASELKLSQIPVDVASCDKDTNIIDSLNQQSRWDQFFSVHDSGQFFKLRQYILPEFGYVFNKVFEDSSVNLIKSRQYMKNDDLVTSNDEDVNSNHTSKDSIWIGEVGCGHGCTIIPLLSQLPSTTHYLATDYSIEALTIFKQYITTHYPNSLSRIHYQPWDVTSAYPDNSSSSSNNNLPNSMKCHILLCIFSLSAIAPQYHIDCFNHISKVLHEDGYLCIRDYGLYDMTMFRHSKRIDNRLFIREDHTLCYYFNVEDIYHYAEKCGYNVIECKYACVHNINRKKNITMKRIFIHAVLQLKKSNTTTTTTTATTTTTTTTITTNTSSTTTTNMMNNSTDQTIVSTSTT